MSQKKYHAVSLTLYASWEWLVVLNKKCALKVLLFIKVNNKYFDQLVKKIKI
jgi:hypothetical protein